MFERPLNALVPARALWVVSGHACLAHLLAHAGCVWGATDMQLRFCLAIIGTFVDQEPPPRVLGYVLAPLNALKPGEGLWVVFGHGCLSRLSASTWRVKGATAMQLRFCLATTGAFVGQEPPPRILGHVLAPLNALKPGGGLWVVSGYGCLVRLFASTGRIKGATAMQLWFFLAINGACLRIAMRGGL